MPRAYFDTNVYDRVRIEDVERLRAELSRRGIVPRLGLADVDEILGDWETNRSAAMSRLQVARDLVGFDEILKQPSTLLDEAIRAYATGEPPPLQILPPDEQELVEDCLYRAARGRTTVDHVMREVVRGVKVLKEESWRTMTAARDRALAEWETIEPERRRTVTFDEYWKAGATQWAEDFAAPLGLAVACRERGLDGLLEVRPVRYCVGAVMSWIFSIVVGDQPRRPQRSDGYDHWHAILASTADVFVTHDERLAGLLARVPLDGFRVVSSLEALLAD